MRFLIHSREAGGPFAWEILKKIVTDGKREKVWCHGKSLKVFCFIFTFFFFKLESRRKTPQTSLCLRQNFLVPLLQVTLERDVGCALHHVLWKCSRHQTALCFISASFYSDWKPHANPKKLPKKVSVKNWWFSIKNYLIGRFPLTALEAIIPFPHNLCSNQQQWWLLWQKPQWL